MKWIIRYLVAREVYRKYSENRTEISESFSLQNISRFAWTLIGIIFFISIFYAFSNRNKLELFQLSKNDSLYVQPWKSYMKNELKFYKMTTKENLYDETKIDTLFHSQFTYKVDTSSSVKKQLLGIYKGISHKTDEGTFLEITRNKKIELTKPIWEDYSYSKSNSYSKKEYVSIEDTRLNNTKLPESRWFQHFILLLIMFFSFRKLRIALFRFFKSKVPIYDREAVYKRDNRYKSGHKIVRYKTVIKEFRKMTDEELSIHKKQQKSRILVSLSVFLLSLSYLIYIYIN